MENSKKGRPSEEYVITIGMAKELGMVERSEKGSLIRKYFIEIEERGITKSEFGRMLDLSRQNVQDVLRRESMDTALLGKISKALDYDFFKELSKKLKSSGE